MNAYKVTHSIFARANQTFLGGCKDCDLGAGVKGASIEAAIRDILAGRSMEYLKRIRDRSNFRYGRKTAACAVLAFWFSRSTGATVEPRERRGGETVMELCDALEEVQPGRRHNIAVSGIFLVGPEHSILYDRRRATCTWDVQPATWVEFAPDVLNRGALAAVMRHSDYAAVTFMGELQGPGEIGPDDLSLPVLAAYSMRVRGPRYGHLGAFRTQFMVKEVLLATIGGKTPEGPVLSKSRKDAEPEVLRSETPRYPPMAQAAGIEGAVYVKVSVRNGEVARAESQVGDRMLAHEAAENVRTWRFAPSTNAEISTVFHYRLERRRTGERASPRIELNLPYSVRITAAMNSW